MPTFDSDGVSLHYEESGAGIPVVLLHGAAASSISLDALIAALARPGLRLIAPDLRGMGKSQRVEAMPPTAWTDDLRRLFDHLELGHAFVCGTSLGARIALRAALEMPERVAGLAIDSLILHDSQRGGELLEAIFGVDAPVEMAANLVLWNGDEGREVGENYLRLRLTPGLQDHYDLRADIGAIHCPTLFTRGDLDDEIHPLQHTVDAYAAVPKAHLWISPGTGFSAMRFQAEEAARHIHRHLIGLDSDA